MAVPEGTGILNDAEALNDPLVKFTVQYGLLTYVAVIANVLATPPDGVEDVVPPIVQVLPDAAAVTAVVYPVATFPYRS